MLPLGRVRTVRTAADVIQTDRNVPAGALGANVTSTLCADGDKSVLLLRVGGSAHRDDDDLGGSTENDHPPARSHTTPGDGGGWDAYIHSLSTVLLLLQGALVSWWQA